MDTIDIIMFGVLCFVLGVIAGAYWIFEIWLRQKPSTPPVVYANLVIDPAVLHQINAHMTLAWLDAQGLTWTAKGAVYDPAKSVKK